jgi:hypothetical protein
MANDLNYTGGPDQDPNDKFPVGGKDNDGGSPADLWAEKQSPVRETPPAFTGLKQAGGG